MSSTGQSSSPKPGAYRELSYYSYGSASPYGYGTAAWDLRTRRVHAVETPYVTHFYGGEDSDGADTPQSPKAIRALASELMRLTVNGDNLSPAEQKEMDVGACSTKLQSALSGAYKTEAQFSDTMFRAMAEGLQRLVPSVGLTVTETNIILTPETGGPAAWTAADGDETYEYATGLARGALASIPAENGCELETKEPRTSDHAWVMYRRPVSTDETSDWEVWRALTVVDFVWDYSNWNIQRSDNGRANVDDGTLGLFGDDNGPLARAIMYALGHAAPGIASLGELPRSIPFAVVQCRISARSKSVDVGCVHGNLLTPEACGELYEFNVDAFGSIHSPKVASSSNDLPVAAYLDVMIKGLQVARRWLQKVEKSRVLPVPHPLTGRVLRFGERRYGGGKDVDDPNLMIINNPVLLGTPVQKYCANGDRANRVRQGELFQANVDVALLRRNLTKHNRIYWCPDAYPTEAGQLRPVLIKVNSQACFHHFMSILTAQLYRVDDSEWERMHELREVLSNSMYGFFHTLDGSGLVQLLPDLRQLGYEPIPHGRDLDATVEGWGNLWSAFANLVRDVLVPMARVDVVHPDIRPGYDYTANVLYNPQGKTMRLIDLDSLCHYNVYVMSPERTDRRYLRPLRLPAPLQDADAMGFVLAQVLCVAEVWLDKTLQLDVDAEDMVRKALPRRRPRPPSPPEPDSARIGGNGGGAGGGGGSDGIDTSNDANNNDEASTFVFDGCAYDSDGNWKAEVNESLIETALQRYQAKFDRLSD